MVVKVYISRLSGNKEVCRQTDPSKSLDGHTNRYLLT